MAVWPEEARRLTQGRALKGQLSVVRGALPMSGRLARSTALAEAMGHGDPAFDMKAHSDEMWGDA